jgi:bifunctional NMN adenylyltransferase/nudix hydrolase
MRKPFKFGFILGRFQHLHDGHVKMIETGLSTCEHLLVLIGSSQESMTLRNPFTLYTRINLFREVFHPQIKDGSLMLGHIDDMTNENDHCTEWGDFVLKKVDMWRQHFGVKEKLDCMIFGNDEERMAWYKPESVEGVNQIVLARESNPISATKMREYLVKDDFATWQWNVPIDMAEKRNFNNLRSELLDIPEYKEMLENE